MAILYEIRHDSRPFGDWSFDYASIGVVTGRSSRQTFGEAALRYGLEGGVRYFQANSTRRDVFQADTYSSSVTGNAAFVAVTYSMEFPSSDYSVAPRFRLETSYPDFGGGDGYSRLHRESDLGFRASVGLEVRRLF